MKSWYVVIVVFFVLVGGVIVYEKDTGNNEKSIPEENVAPIIKNIDSEVVIFTGTYDTTNYDVPNRDFEYSKNIDDGVCHQIEVIQPFNTEARSLIEGINRGNSVYKLSDSGGLLINLPWNDISEIDKNIIRSAIDSSVSIQFKKKEIGGHGVGACYSFYEYVGIVE